MADSDGKILASEFIDSGIKTELKAVVDEMQRLVKVTSDLMGVVRQSTNDQKGYVTVQKEVEKVSKDIVAVESKMKVLDTDLAKEAERKKQAYQKAAKEQKDNIAAETSAYKRLSVEYGKALQKAKDLAAQYGVQSEQAKKAIATAKEFNDKLKAIDASMGNHQRNVGNYAEAIETANMSLGEMKRTLRELRDIPLVGKTPEEVAQINKQMAMLTDEMGDYQARMRSSGDSTQVMIEGLQGVVAVAQGVTGALSAMGFNTEKLDKAMVQLIGVSQALATVHELNEKQTLKTVAALIKDTYAKAANAVATKAQTLATNGATVASRALGKAMKSIPFVAIAAAISAVVAGAVLLVKRMTEASTASKIMTDATEKASESIGQQRGELEKYLLIAKDTKRSYAERQAAINEINKISPEYLGNISLENINTRAATDAVNQYNSSIGRKARLIALQNILVEKYTELEKEKDLHRRIAIEEEIKKTEELIQKQIDLADGKFYNEINMKGGGEEYEGKEMMDYMTGNVYVYTGGKWVLKKQPPKDKSGGSTPERTPLDELTDAIAAANQSYLLQTSLLKDELDPQKQYLSLMDAEINKNNAICDAYKKYYEQDKSYSDDELAVLQRLNAKTKALEEQKIALEKLFETAENAPKKPEPTISGGVLNDEITAFSGFTPRDESMPDVSGATNLIDIIGVLNDEITAFLENYGESIRSVYDSIGSIISNTFEAQNDAIDEQQKKSDEYFANKLKAYEDDADAVRQINAEKDIADKKFERERKAIAIRAAKFEKAQALVSIGVNQAKAVMNIIATMPPPSWPFLIAITAATGLAETAAVMSKPIPQYASGIESTPKTGAALVGERGSEAILYPDGSVAIADKPTVTILPKGTEVKNAFDTEDYLRKLSFAAMLPRIGKTDANEKDYTAMLKDIHRTLKRGNTVINQGMSAREQYYYKKYSV